MTNEELNDGCARAMGITVLGDDVDESVVLEGAKEEWWVRKGNRHPAIDWRDTGVVLEWLLSATSIETVADPAACILRVLLPDGWKRIGADTWNRAICMAAIEVGRG